ncbi:HK97 family phage prohead protease [Roseibium litorale]|uniref:HK97 family phage prohead protease n=1 Tax=Roseibium litorale TaxID=2803841 RepID=A0ABR9CSX3_9HYPH|nr:HK97 family phage prohead protease [Roseibium litorale]MBD8893500.1 HK97 family phage prohead protease [Roseibium litorale]
MSAGGVALARQQKRAEDLLSGRIPVTGYASLFEQLDGAGDIIRRGAFQRSLETRGSGGLAILWQHDPAAPIGIWTSLREDRVGLRVSGYLLKDVEQAREAAVLISAGVATGLSIGFKARRSFRSTGRGPRILTDIDLWEVSIVTFPQAEGARVQLAGPAPAPAIQSRSRSKVSLAGRLTGTQGRV